MKKLVIVSGASGALGQAYLDYFDTAEDTQCVAIARRAVPERGVGSSLVLDLLDASTVRSAVEAMNLEGVSNILYIHPVGKFKFEESGFPEADADGDGIDDEVYASNIDTFQNVVGPLLERLQKEQRPIPLTLCAFGSISDKYAIKYWQSYSRAKNILREKMRALAENAEMKIKSVFIRVSTADTQKERELRPFAETRYWLGTKEIVESSVSSLGDGTGWTELALFKPMPDFKEEYYRSLPAVREKWSREMGRKLL